MSCNGGGIYRHSPQFSLHLPRILCHRHLPWFPPVLHARLYPAAHLLYSIVASAEESFPPHADTADQARHRRFRHLRGGISLVFFGARAHVCMCWEEKLCARALPCWALPPQRCRVGRLNASAKRQPSGRALAPYAGHAVGVGFLVGFCTAPRTDSPLGACAKSAALRYGVPRYGGSCRSTGPCPALAKAAIHCVLLMAVW